MASSKQELSRYLGPTKMAVVQGGGVGSEMMSSKRVARRLMERMKICRSQRDMKILFPGSDQDGSCLEKNKKFHICIAQYIHVDSKVLRKKNCLI